MSKFYTGVGSRTTPDNIRFHMLKIADTLSWKGYVLRSGGADRADTYFAEGAAGNSHIYLPWPGFNNITHCHRSRPSLDAYRMAAGAHPKWSSLGSGPRALHARNCHQVLGDDLKTPSEFLICWTRDGCQTEKERTRDTGGTGTAIILASRNNIPVFNLQRPGAVDVVYRFIESLPYV